MKVLVADKLEQSALDGLKNHGCEVVQNADLNGDTLPSALSEHQPTILIVRSTLVPAPAIEAGTNLKLIIRAGAGVNNIDLAAASAHGVSVANCPGKNAVAVAELAFGLMLSLDRFIPDNVTDLRNGKWNKKTYSKGIGLFGQTLGLVGMGSIGQEMIPRAKAFGMNVLIYSRWMSNEDAEKLGVTKAGDLKDIARQSDIVSLHTSLSSDTRGMINADFINAMKPGAMLINTARAEVVDQAALLGATTAGKIRAGLDVFEGEPSAAEAPYEGPLSNAKGIYCTHHIGASTNQAQEAVAAEVVRIVEVFQSTGTAPNVVNG
ncbi:MAG: hypothetical protein KF824_06665 [Fimbriimonadaceae bacterium]|nr:MAG: hypothetical protein KF824_06665 [Fimbriimonadaceae bacterium]